MYVRSLLDQHNSLFGQSSFSVSLSLYLNCLYSMHILSCVNKNQIESVIRVLPVCDGVYCTHRLWVMYM